MSTDREVLGVVTSMMLVFGLFRLIAVLAFGTEEDSIVIPVGIIFFGLMISIHLRNTA